MNTRTKRIFGIGLIIVGVGVLIATGHMNPTPGVSQATEALIVAENTRTFVAGAIAVFAGMFVLYSSLESPRRSR